MDGATRCAADIPPSLGSNLRASLVERVIEHLERSLDFEHYEQRPAEPSDTSADVKSHSRPLRPNTKPLNRPCRQAPTQSVIAPIFGTIADFVIQN
ncbi:hypothetical protein [Enterovirga sp. CN4-39]|uniref:hypothetical protein n=1 Tax=Enterovirga sp. CN4-39 TaxID=3400910 RepID=UPI003C01365B